MNRTEPVATCENVSIGISAGIALGPSGYRIGGAHGRGHRSYARRTLREAQLCRPTPGKRLLVGASGSASVTALPAHLTALHSELDVELTVVMTRSARQLLPEQTVGLHAERVVTGDDPGDWPTDNQTALAPTANMPAVAATGAAPNLLGGIILAAPGPWPSPR